MDAVVRMRRYASRILIALDITLNVMLLGHYTTLSARAYMARARGKRWGRLMANALDAIVPGHCEASVMGDIERANTIIRELSAE